MIPYILIIIGIVLTLVAIIGFIRLLLLPFTRMRGVVFEREDDFLKYQSREGKKYFRSNLKQITWIYLAILIAGLSCFLLGMYLGYAAKGDSFWLYRQIFGEDKKIGEWDRISEDGTFIAEDGKEYKYYILVDGKECSFCGETCADLTELSADLDDIRRENTVILIDSFAVSSVYRDVEQLLKESGIKYETEEE